MIDTPPGNEFCSLKQVAFITESEDTDPIKICDFCQKNNSLSGSGVSQKYVVVFSGDRKRKVHEFHFAELAQRLDQRAKLWKARESRLINTPVPED